jgi:hypothetical protein
MKMLLVLALFIGSVSVFGAAQGFGTGTLGGKSDLPKTVPHAVNPHRDVPKNCQQTLEADDSVLLTCECEACGQPDARDGLNPLPWSCELRQERLFCGYGGSDSAIIDTRSSGRSRI